METKSNEPYIYQPYGMQDELHWETQRIYGIGGYGIADIKGLTKEQAENILAAIKTPVAELESRLAEAHKRIRDLRAKRSMLDAECKIQAERLVEANESLTIAHMLGFEQGKDSVKKELDEYKRAGITIGVICDKVSSLVEAYEAYMKAAESALNRAKEQTK